MVFFKHNAITDRQAVQANLCRSEGFWDLFARHLQACNFAGEIFTEVRRVLLLISQSVVQSNDVGLAQLEEVSPASGAALPLPAWHGLGLLSIPAKAVQWYGDTLYGLSLAGFGGLLRPVRKISGGLVRRLYGSH